MFTETCTLVSVQNTCRLTFTSLGTDENHIQICHRRASAGEYVHQVLLPVFSYCQLAAD